MSTDLSSPTQALELSVTWSHEWPNPQTTIYYRGEEGEWANVIASAVHDILPRHDLTVWHESAHPNGDTVVTLLETDHVRVLVEYDA